MLRASWIAPLEIIVQTGTTAPCDFASAGTSNKGCARGKRELVNISWQLSKRVCRQGAGCGAETHGQGFERGRFKVACGATKAKPASNGTLRNRETPVEGGPRPGNRAKWREGFRLLQGLRLDRLLVVPKTAAHSDCSGNAKSASKEDPHCQPPF